MVCDGSFSFRKQTTIPSLFLLTWVESQRIWKLLCNESRTLPDFCPCFLNAITICLFSSISNFLPSSLCVVIKFLFPCHSSHPGQNIYSNKTKQRQWHRNNHCSLNLKILSVPGHAGNVVVAIWHIINVLLAQNS